MTETVSNHMGSVKVETSSPEYSSGSAPPRSCPMHQDHKQSAPPLECPMHKASAPAQQAPKTSPSVPETPAHQDRAYEFVECPMKAARGENGAMSDINPANMLAPPSRATETSERLSCLRLAGRVCYVSWSTLDQAVFVARAGSEQNWVYPSEQMFWNAMLRKGWRWNEGDIGQKDMKSIIKIHNQNNEMAWQEILRWEALHSKCVEND
ncbi:holocytochrome c-type synthase-like [Alosa pseudoharengus]|uniref:holocytochrome c-type synthase-like n=1 Tax=Alosa pseudoharengus TaxID=34774 RepID=UPI003F8C922B